MLKVIYALFVLLGAIFAFVILCLDCIFLVNGKKPFDVIKSNAIQCNRFIELLYSEGFF